MTSRSMNITCCASCTCWLIKVVGRPILIRFQRKSKSRSLLRLCLQTERLDASLVVLVFINALADMVLLAVDLVLFRLGQVAIVLRHIPFFLVLNMVFPVF
jgi:hypothetical protein